MSDSNDCVVYWGNPRVGEGRFIRRVLRLHGGAELQFEFEEMANVSEALRVHQSVAVGIATMLSWYFCDEPGLWSMGTASSFGYAHPAEEVRYRECLECPCVAESTLFQHSEWPESGGYYCPDCGSAHTVDTDALPEVE